MIIGRKEEIELLKNITKDDRSHFVAVYGRRRIGKHSLSENLMIINLLFSMLVYQMVV